MRHQDQKYDRALLLSGAKRNEVLELWEVRRYGTDSYGDADYVSIYGMRPAGLRWAHNVPNGGTAPGAVAYDRHELAPDAREAFS